MRKRARITGITGHDGAYLAELLLSKGYDVHGIKRRASSFNNHRIDHLYEDSHAAEVRLRLHYGDLTDATNVLRISSRGSRTRPTTWRRKAMCKCRSRHRSTRPMPMRSAYCVSSRASASCISSSAFAVLGLDLGDVRAGTAIAAE